MYELDAATVTSIVRIFCRGERPHHVADQRRLAVAARRDQEDLLPVGQVAAEPLALVVAVGERRRGDDLAVDERVVGSRSARHYVIIRNGYAKQRNILR